MSLAEERGWRVYLYGRHPDVVLAARDPLCAMIAQLEIVGVCVGYNSRTSAEISRTSRQAERTSWSSHLAGRAPARNGCRLGVSVGAFLNFVSGRVVRAPRWMNRPGVGWLCRLMWNLAGSGGRTSSATPVFSGGHADSAGLDGRLGAAPSMPAVLAASRSDAKS